MERLTIDDVIEHCKRKTKKYENLNGVNTLETADISLSFIKEYWEHRQVKEYLEELKRYRDLEEQGLLLRLSCKIGDTIWYVDDDDDDYPIKLEIDTISIDNNKNIWYYANDDVYGKFGFIDSDFGKYVFLTQAEAEQKLKEMESD